jgi:hypothetical protein
VHLSSRVVCDTCGASSERYFWDDNCIYVDVHSSTAAPLQSHNFAHFSVIAACMRRSVPRALRGDNFFCSLFERRCHL